MTTMNPAEVSCACNPFAKFPRGEFEPAEPDLPRIHTRGKRHWQSTGIALDAGSKGRDHAGWVAPDGWDRGREDRDVLR
jgi:hypothetical protein